MEGRAKIEAGVKVLLDSENSVEKDMVG